MKERTVGALALLPTGNAQGGYLLLSLLTGQRLNCHHVTPLSMPEEVISQVHDMTQQNPTGIAILDRNNHPFAFADSSDNSDNPENVDNGDNKISSRTTCCNK